jgi:addiction module HigA family antidote
MPAPRKTAPLKPHPNFPMPHPGGILAEAIDAIDDSKSRLAERLGITRKMLYDILNEKSAITAAMAVKLETVIGSSAEFWLGLQSRHDLWKARRLAKTGSSAPKAAARKRKAA